MALQLDRREAPAAVRDLARRRGVAELDVWQAIVDAVELAYRREHPVAAGVSVELDLGSVQLAVVDADGVDVTPAGFGRIAANVFKGNVAGLVDRLVHARAARRFASRVGSLVSGTVKHASDTRLIVEVEGVEAVLPRRLVPRHERWAVGDRVTALVVSVVDEGADVLVLSRTGDAFVRALFAAHCPAVASGSVELVAVGREPGRRTKVVVAAAVDVSGRPAVRDAVAVVLGAGAASIAGVTAELGRERVDVVAVSDDLAGFVAALVGVGAAQVAAGDPVDGVPGFVITPAPGQRRRVIGPQGSNVRLAERLAGVRIMVAGATDPDDGAALPKGSKVRGR